MKPQTKKETKAYPNKVLTTDEVADLLRVHRTTICRFAKSGMLRSYLLGTRRLFKESDVWAFFEKQAVMQWKIGASE